MKSKNYGQMLSTVFVFVLVLNTVSMAHAQERLFKNADIAAGKTLHSENNCSTCHQQRTGKNEKEFYTRLDRKVTTQEKLISQIAYCSSQLSLSFFPEDELNIAAFLNNAYYKLK